MDGVTFVIPCLNEKLTLRSVLIKINEVRKTTLSSLSTEVIVSDNGSTDGSQLIAQAEGVRVCPCPVRGYGAALQNGIREATYDTVIFADADDTYDFAESPRLIAELQKGFDLVLGSRFRGKIEQGAMPLMHRYLGTPVLTFILKVLYGKPARILTDCNSGFRCFSKKAFFSWKATSPGMEFASEMLVRALKNEARISEVPATLKKGHPERKPHLRTWMDGMRHLLQILHDAPEFFQKTGFLFFAVSWTVLLVGLLWGRLSVLGVSVFDLHSMMFALVLGIFGIQFWAIGLNLSTRVKSKSSIYSYFREMPEDKLFFRSLFAAIAVVVLIIPIFYTWEQSGFKFLALEKPTLVTVSVISHLIVFWMSVVSTHLMKRLKVE